ncbi:MAG: methyl viologen-reducing hydrogenase [Thermoanaerobaculia bacterium]|nr:methyl viologen-reducing hydrogenase [Thermoanaerobaculia bacterium]MCZ7650133.1 methyl viologen-reducing hydrogenase [Thermoanaerobaculia bacterium]
MSAKARVSIEWLSGCSGCELGIVDLHEKLLEVLDEIELVRIPILMDVKEYVAADVGILTGSIRTEHDRHAAREMRRLCKSILAFGTCPVYGGPHSSAYPHTTDELLDGAYRSNASTVTSEVPTDVPRLLAGNRPLDSEIEVDLYLPGCPPHPAFIFEALMSLVRGRAPGIGRHSVCFRCERKMVKTDRKTLRRAFEGEFDPEICFLSQGCLCFGSVTLDRCLAPCTKVGVPCFSCGGPSEPVILEPQKDVRSEVALRMSHLTQIPEAEIVAEIERQAKTHFAYAMASPVFRQKPTFLLKKWTQSPTPAGGTA